MNAAVRQTGIVTAGMTMVRNVPRKARITRLTSTVVAMMVW